MKIRITLFYITVLWQLPIVAQTSNINAIDTYFSQYVEDERFSIVYVSARLFELMKSVDVPELRSEGEKDKNDLLKHFEGLQGLRVLRTDETPEKFYKEAKGKIDTKLYEPLMTVRSKDGKNTEFMVKTYRDSNKVQELLLLSGSPEEFVLLSFIGNLDLEDISKFAKEVSENN